ncbi:YesL family protein [Paenibacillus pinistramenti]|uniref:YesL family protein n=1 Tax=Paenibacillus pinistramenti TaxID=1768003 RepID=UPI0011090261|nr:DUF624 domain-containing protein [Paenibacillus pinistramenti]
MEFRGVTGGLYRVTEWIMRIAGSNLLWLVCSSPFLFFVLTKLLIVLNGLGEDGISVYAMAILAPFTLFPATAALFTVVRKWVMGEADVSVTRTFFRGYKENYKQSMVGGIFYTLLFVVMAVDYTVYMGKMKNLQVIGMLMLVLLVLLLISMFNFFSMVSHYHLKTSTMIKNAVLLTIIRPFRSFSTLAGAAVLLYMTYRFSWLMVFGTATLLAWLAFVNFYATFTKMQAQLAKMNEAEEAKAAEAAASGAEADHDASGPLTNGENGNSRNS